MRRLSTASSPIKGRRLSELASPGLRRRSGSEELGGFRKITSSSSMNNVNAAASTAFERERDNGRILVILTGGTMAMKPNARGALEPEPGYLAEQMHYMPELRDRNMAAYEVVEYNPLLDSADMHPDDWARIAGDVAAGHDDYDGFVIIMGTDTMAYLASALSFMLEGLRKPVILTGSMIPFAEAYSDARHNLIMSMIFATTLGEKVPEVCVCFGDKLLRGNRTSKIDALALAAYESPNFPPLATCGVAMNYSGSALAVDRDGPATCAVHGRVDTKIIVFKMVPGFSDEAMIACTKNSDLKAIVLELYGTGTAPARKKGMLAFLRAARAADILVVATTQCRRGGVVLGTYEVGRQLTELGVVGGGDMTTECVATKLAYLFGRYESSAAVRRLVGVSLRGELSMPETYLRPFFEDVDAAAGGRKPLRLTAHVGEARVSIPEAPPPPRRSRLLDVALGAGIALLALAAARRRRSSKAV